MTRETLSERSEAQARAHHPVSLALKFAIVFLAFVLAVLSSSCVKRSEIKAAVWLNLSISEETCRERPELRDVGVYRRLNDGRFEFVSFCSPLIEQYFSIYRDDLERILRETLPNDEANRVMKELEQNQQQ
jgi:hypothetical protein